MELITLFMVTMKVAQMLPEKIMRRKKCYVFLLIESKVVATVFYF